VLRKPGAALLIGGIIALAVNLRVAITSLPPVFPELHAALPISTAAEAALAATPVLCFGVFSGLGAPLSRAFGEERVLGAALLLLTGGLVLRAVAPGPLLFPGTVAASGAIALMNVLLPSLIKRRRPDRSGLLIGLYLLALTGGAILGALIAVPVFVAAGGTGLAARVTLGMWAVPALLAAVIWVPQLRYRTEPEPLPVPGRQRGALAMGRHALAWQVTAFMGLQSLTYYAALSWLPTLFRDRGVSAVQAGDLLAQMNLGNTVTALLMPVLAHRARDQRLLTAAAVAVTGAGLAGAAFGPLITAAPFIFLLGLGQGATLGLGIFYTMARAADPAAAASLSAFAQGIGYLVASAGPLLVGYLHTATGGWAIPVWLLLGVTALQLITGWPAGRARTVPFAAPQRGEREGGTADAYGAAGAPGQLNRKYTGPQPPV
jgi:CP family cyanate transporter-like MFS transporter